MKRLPILLTFATLPTAWSLDVSLVRESGPRTPEEEATGFKLPPGFRAHLFAAEPQVNKPINMAFDAKGRMWVSSSYEYPYGAPKERWVDAEGSRVKDSRDGIFILEDTDGDGRADKKTVFADGLNIPTGVLPYKNGCFAWSIPNIWYFEDTNGDDVCDKRTVVFGPLGWEKDVHGNCSSLRLAPDGWIYGTHGFSNTSHFKVLPQNLKGAKPGDPGTELSLNSGNVYRFLPDGSRIELVTAGQVNPFGLAWDPLGNLYSADCHSSPIYQLLPGACYPSFGKPHDGLGFGPVMIQHTHSSTGICGITYLDGSAWGPEWKDRIIIGNVVTSRINLDRVTFNGSTPTAHEEPDFLASDDPWFRPVDLQMGPDGALYVADFYNKVIGHYEVPLTHPGRDKERGRIWKITKDGVTKHNKPPITEIAALRFRARTGPLDVETLAKVRTWLDSPDPNQKRAAVEALRRPASVDDLPKLVNILTNTTVADESLRHQTRIVIREHLKVPGAIEKLRGLTFPWETENELTVIARAVNSPDAAAFLFERLRKGNASAQDIKETLTRIATQLPAAELAAFVREKFAKDDGAQADLLLAINDGVLQRGELPDASLTSWGNSLANRLLAAAPQSAGPAWSNDAYPGAKPSPSPWSIRKRELAGGGQIDALDSIGRGGEDEKRTGVLRSAAFPAPASLSFALCGHRGAPDKPEHGKNFVRLIDENGKELHRADPPRSDAAARVTWDLADIAGKPVRVELADGDTGDAYAWLAAGDFQPAVISVSAYDTERLATTRLTGLATLLKYAAPPGLREKLAVFLPAPPPPPPSAVTPEERAETDKLIAARTAAYEASKPDLTAGATTYTTNCAICHAIDGKGAFVGPQLDGIGNRGANRLIEDILDPSRNVDSHFRLHIITSKDGSVFAGLERGEAGALLIGVDAAGQEHRLPKANITTNEETGLSLMPAAFAHSIPEADFNNLLGYLLSHKAAP